MNCQRCKSNEVRYRAYTKAMDTKVCTSCAIVALQLGIAIVDIEDSKPIFSLATLEKV